MRAGWLVIPGFSWYKPTYDVRVICLPNFHNFPPFRSIFIRTPCQYLAGKRVFSPCDQEIPNQGILERSVWRSKILLDTTRVDPTRVGGGQLSLPGVSWYKPTYNVMGPETIQLYGWVSFLVVAGNSFQNENRFLQKILLGYFLWSASRCPFFIRPNTFLLCIILLCIFLLYRTDPQVEVKIRILLKDKYEIVYTGNPTLISQKMTICFFIFKETTR